MFQEETETSKKTKQLLFSILEYCSSNNLKMWLEGGYFHKFYIGNQNFFEENQKNKNLYLPTSIEVTSKSLNEDIYDIYFNKKNGNGTNTSISAIPQWAQNNQKEYNELYVHAFWNSGKDVTSVFAEHWLLDDSFNLAESILYKNKEYPNGFSDSKLTSYTKEKNWIHFLDTIPVENLAHFWNENEKLDQLHNALKKIESRGLNVHSYLRTLTDRLAEHGLSEDVKLRSSYMLMDLIPENLRRGYSEKFPFMKVLMAEKHKESLFPQKDEEIIEKVSFPKNHIYQYFNNPKINASEYILLSKETLKVLGENKELKNLGLVSLDVIETEDVTAYLSLNTKELINKYEFKALFVKIMESYLLNNEFESKESKPKIKTIADTVVNHWLMDKSLSNKTDEPSNAKKKMKL